MLREPDLRMDDPASVSNWISWAQRELNSFSARESSLTLELGNLRKELQERSDDLQAYKRIVEKNKTTTLIDVGSDVFVKSELQAKVAGVFLGPRGSVSYMVAYWDDNRYVRAWLPDSEVSVEQEGKPLPYRAS